MALILDETFASGIPGSFATARQQAGTLSVTYNGAEQAVDLSNATAGQSIWDITSTPLCAAGEMEVDLELMGDPVAIKHLGLWLVAGTGAVSTGVGISHLNSVYQYNLWSGSTDWAGEAAPVTTPDTGLLFPIGTRRTFNARWDMRQAGPPANLEIRVDGSLLLSVTQTYTSFRAGIFLYSASVRVHSIKMWDEPTVAFRDVTVRGFQAAQGRRSLAPVEATDSLGVRNINREQVRGVRNIYFAGNGRITGTVKEKGTASNAPVHRRVVLVDERTRLPAQEQWSNPATGGYSFDCVDITRRYTVLSYDYTGAYRAVVADGQIPELIP